MDTVQRRRSPVYCQVEAYKESWQRDHEAVQECWALEDTLAVGITTAALIERVDRVWRDRVFRGNEEPSDEANDLHRSLFTLWLGVTEEVLQGVARLEEVYGEVNGAQELRQAAEWVRARLARWEPPRLSQAVGLREMALTPEAATELDRLLAGPPAPSTSGRQKMQEMSAEEFKRLRQR